MAWLNLMLRKLRRLSELSPCDLLVFVQLIFFDLAARATLAFVSLPRVLKFLSVSAQSPVAGQFPLGHRWQDSARLAITADLAARAIRAEGPCLVRALSLFWLLKARGQQVELLIGVRKEGALLNGHAWIESQGKIIADTLPMTSGFATLLRF
jgi:transglutaminase superfamily protein